MPVLAGVTRYFKFVFLALVAAVFVIFSIENRQPVMLTFFPLPYSAQMPEFILSMLCFIIGAFTGGLCASRGLWRIKHQHNQAKKRSAALENELKALQMQQGMPTLPAKQP